MPDPLASPAAFAERARDLVRQHGCEFVLPVTDASILALLARPAAVSPARIPIPAYEVFQRASDKARVAEIAGSCGIRVPRQVLVAGPGDVASAAAASGLRAPLVLKPARSVADGHAGRGKHGVRHADDWPDTVRVASDLSDGAFPLLVQERILGPGIGIFLLVWNGQVVAAFAHRRLREKPPAGGVSVLCESVPLDEALLEVSVSLLRCFDWSGVAMVEYKRDAETGEPVLMEINGRFWGSLQLAVDSGVDFPRLLLECALGKSPAPVTSYRVGVRNRWWWGDADHLLTRLRHSAKALHLPPRSPGRFRAVVDFLSTGLTGARGQVFQSDDPWPAGRELRDRLREFLRI